MLQQYKYHFKRISVLDNYAILESLPTTARTSLLFAQYHDAVDQLSFLQARLIWRLTLISGLTIGPTVRAAPDLGRRFGTTAAVALVLSPLVEVQASLGQVRSGHGYDERSP